MPGVMKIAFLDSTAVVASGPGSPAYFSRFVIKRLREQGHEVIILPGFDEDVCGDADAVVCEWANDEAFQAAASGVCKRLVVRVRGFDAHGPLDKLVWQNVDLLVYESAFLKDYVASRFEPFAQGKVHGVVLPGGIDLGAVNYRRRNNDVGPVVALIARATADKGYQLAFEYARQHPAVRFHVTTALADSAPRLAAYLQHSKPHNVTIHGTVDTTKWLNDIVATHVLSCSIWETLGYTIAEGMAVGCKPLIHNAPGTNVNWPQEFLWTSFADLDKLLWGPFESDDYRGYAEKHFDERVLSQEFIDILLGLPARPGRDPREFYYAFRDSVTREGTAVAADRTRDPATLATAVEAFRGRWPEDRFAEDRYAMACGVSAAYLVRGDAEKASVWAARAAHTAPWPEAFCLLAESALVQGKLEDALAWYRAEEGLPLAVKRFTMPQLVSGTDRRRDELHEAIDRLPGGPTHDAAPTPHIAVVVTVRNAERWIDKCLQSIAAQRDLAYPLRCLVIDDVSTDRTGEIAREFVAKDPRFVLVTNTERKWQARNTVEGARLVARTPEDVIVLVDGDDWLETDALKKIETAYERGAWMTYGNYRTSDFKDSRHGPYPHHVAKSGAFADWTWQATAPRTFKRFLLDELKDEDFLLDGAWPKVAGDVCVLLPMLQMACERAAPLSGFPVYIYNTETPDNDHKQAADEQVRVRDRLMDRPVKARLER